MATSPAAVSSSSISGRYSPTRAGKMWDSHALAGSRTPASCSRTEYTPSAPRNAGTCPAAATLLQRGKNRPNADWDTGRACARAAARDRERIVRNTSVAMNSCSSTPWRNRPSMTLPDSTRRDSGSCAAPTARPNAEARSRSVNGPRVRTQRPTSWASASGIVSTWAGTPGGMGTPKPSRSSGASRTCAT